MRIHLGSDHAGFALKNAIREHLSTAGHEVTDHGAHAYDDQDDYPPFCIAAAEAVAGDPGSRGIVVGGSGNGEQIAANEVTGIRAALVWSIETATLAREHNDANVMGIGARMHDESTALTLVDAFVATPFSNAPRHARRIALLTAYEATRS